MLYCMMLLYNVYVCLLKFLRKICKCLGGEGEGGFFLFFFCNDPCYGTVLFSPFSVTFQFVGFYFERATCLIFIY